MSTVRKKFEIRATTYAKNGMPLATAVNSYKKSHPIQSFFAHQVGLDCKRFLHAEIAAILKSGKKVIHRIKIERYGADGRPLLAAPCPVCCAAINAYGIKVVEHT